MVSVQQSADKEKVVNLVKNLARDYALDFTSGKTHKGVLVNGNGNGNGHALVDEEEELLSRPPGFFADQFEVCIGNFASARANCGPLLSPTEPQQLCCSFYWHWPRNLAADKWRSQCLCRWRWSVHSFVSLPGRLSYTYLCRNGRYDRRHRAVPQINGG